MSPASRAAASQQHLDLPATLVTAREPGPPPAAWPEPTTPEERLEPAPRRPAGPPPISARATVAQAWQVLLKYPRATIFPLIAIQVPVTVVSSLATVALYFSAFRNEPFESVNDVLSGGASGPLLALILLTAFEGLFAQVARAATIVAVAAALEGRPKRLTESLDPAFTRMGGLLVLAVVLACGVVGLALTLVGIVLLPYLAARLGLVFEAYMLDGRGPVAALSRSWRVMRGNVLRFLTTVILFLLVAAGPLVLISLLGSVDFGDRDTRVLTSAALAIAQGILLIPLLAFLTAITTAFYLQARARHDGRTTA